MAKPLLEVLRDVSLDPSERAAFTADPSQYLSEHGYEGVPAEDLSEAFGLMHDTLPAETAQALAEDPVYELPDAGDALDDDTAAEVGDLAPFGEVNGDFDRAPDDETPDDLGDDVDLGDEGDLDDDLGDVDEVVIGDGFRDDDLQTDDLGEASTTDVDDLDEGGVGPDDDVSLGDDALGFGLGSAGVADDGSLTADEAGLTSEDYSTTDDVNVDLDDVDGFGLTGETGGLGLDDPVSGDLDADFGDEAATDHLGEGLDDVDGLDDAGEDLLDDFGGIADVGLF